MCFCVDDYCGRPVGIPVKGVLTFGVSSEYDSTTGFAMQIILVRTLMSCLDIKILRLFPSLMPACASRV